LICVLEAAVAVRFVGAVGVGTVTVKTMELLAWPPTVTTTFPVVAPVGTGTTMLGPPQIVGVATVPLNVTVLEPWLTPKFVPAIVIEVPTGPAFGVRLEIVGVGTGTVNVSPLLT
jgi:hypothetical protein